MDIQVLSVRITFLLIVISTVFIGSLLQSCHTVPETSAASDKYRLVWNDNPALNITVAWDQNENTNPVVLYGTQDHGKKFWKYKFSKRQTGYQINMK